MTNLLNATALLLAIFLAGLSASPLPLSATVTDLLHDDYATTTTSETFRTVLTTVSDVAVDASTSSASSNAKWLRPCLFDSDINYGLTLKDEAMESGCQSAFQLAIKAADHVARDLHQEAKCIKTMFDNVFRDSYIADVSIARITAINQWANPRPQNGSRGPHETLMSYIASNYEQLARLADIADKLALIHQATNECTLNQLNSHLYDILCWLHAIVNAKTRCESLMSEEEPVIQQSQLISNEAVAIIEQQVVASALSSQAELHDWQHFVAVKALGAAATLGYGLTELAAALATGTQAAPTTAPSAITSAEDDASVAVSADASVTTPNVQSSFAVTDGAAVTTSDEVQTSAADVSTDAVTVGTSGVTNN